VDEASTVQRVSRLLLTAYPDDWQRGHAVRWLGLIACHTGDGERLNLRAVNRPGRLGEFAFLMHWRERARVRRLLARAAECGILREGRSGYQFADPSVRAVIAASHRAVLAERARRRAALAARAGARAALIAFLTDTRIFRIAVDFGLGGGIAFYVWKLPFFSHPWGGLGAKIFLFIIVVWGAGMLAAGIPFFILGPARELSRWTLAHVPDLSRRQRLAGTLAAVAAAAAVIATTWAVLVSAVAVVLPAVFVAACGLWACVLTSRVVRKTARRWPKALPDVVGAATVAASLSLVARHDLLGTEPAAGFLFPLAVWGSVTAWLAMKRARRLAARAGADLVLSLLLGAELILFLVWLANLLGMPRPEVAALRSVLARAGAAVDLPWWLWATLYVFLAAVSLAFVLRPAATAGLRRWFGRLRIVSVTDVTRRLLGGVHIGLLAVALVAMATPAALGPTFQRQLAAAYTVALQRQFEARGELAAYTQIRRRFAGGSAPQPLVQIVTEIHGDSPPPAGDDDATTTEDQIAQRLGALQAATLSLSNAQALPDAEAAAARRAGLVAPVRGEPDLAHRLAEVDAQDQNDEQAQANAQQAGELAARAIASTISAANTGGKETFQIVGEYLAGLVEESSVKDTFAAWAERLAGGAAPPDAAAMVIPDPGKLEHAAYEELVSEFAAEGDAGELSDDPALSNAMSESPIGAAVTLASQALQVSSGSCAACTPSGPGDEPPEPPADDGG
jgi:hypothetical protein